MGIAMLVLYHLLQRTVLEVLLLLLYVEKFFLFFFLHFHILSLSLDFFLETLFRHLNIGLQLLLHSLVLCYPHHFLLLLLSETLLLLLLGFLVTLPLRHYIFCSFLCFVYFFPCLHIHQHIWKRSIEYKRIIGSPSSFSFPCCLPFVPPAWAERSY